MTEEKRGDRHKPTDEQWLSDEKDYKENLIPDLTNRLNTFRNTGQSLERFEQLLDPRLIQILDEDTYGRATIADANQLVREIFLQLNFELEETTGQAIPENLQYPVVEYITKQFLLPRMNQDFFEFTIQPTGVLGTRLDSPMGRRFEGESQVWQGAYGVEEPAYKPTLEEAGREEYPGFERWIDNTLQTIFSDYRREIERFPDAYLRDQKIEIIGRQAQQKGHITPQQRSQDSDWIKNILNNLDRWNEAVDIVATEGIKDYEIIADRIFESEEPAFRGWKDIGKPVMDLDVAQARAEGFEEKYENYVNKIDETVQTWYDENIPEVLLNTTEAKNARKTEIAEIQLQLREALKDIQSRQKTQGFSDESMALEMESNFERAREDTVDRIKNKIDQNLYEKERKEGLDAVKDASGARRVLENALNTILGVNGYKDLPDYAMDIMTTDILSYGMNANMTGSPLPDVSTIIAPYLGYLDGWMNEKQTQSFLNDPGLINQVAKNALGINESTDPEIKSILESRAIPQLSEQIQNILASNPSMGYTPNYISQDLMQTHGVTPTGEFKPLDMGVGLLQSLGIDIPQQIEHVSPLTFDMPQGVQNVANMLRNMSATDIVSQQLDPSRPPGMGGQAIVDTLGGVEPIGGRGVMKMPTLSDYASQLMPSLQANISDITPEFAQYLSQADMMGETPLSSLLREYQASQQIPDLPSDMLQAAIGAEERAAARRFTPERVISDFVMPTSEVLAPSGFSHRSFDDPFSIRMPSAVIPGKPLDPRGIPYYGQATAAVGDIFRSQLPSPEEFLETGMPQLRQGFEASPFFTQQEERITSEREAEEAFAQREADIAERERRVALRPTATSIFGRRQ